MYAYTDKWSFSSKKTHNVWKLIPPNTLPYKYFGSSPLPDSIPNCSQLWIPFSTFGFNHCPNHSPCMFTALPPAWLVFPNDSMPWDREGLMSLHVHSVLSSVIRKTYWIHMYSFGWSQGLFVCFCYLFFFVFLFSLQVSFPRSWSSGSQRCSRQRTDCAL